MLNRLFDSTNQRSKLVKINILSGIGARGVSILASLLLVPLTITYISSELYGIWLTLSSVIQWIGFFDIGFGNGLRNKLSESIALGKFKKGKIYLSTTYAVLILIFSIIGIVSYFVADNINWSSFLNVSQQYNPILVVVSKILFLAFSAQMVLKIVQNVIQAYQLNALAALLDALGNILSLGFIYMLTITMAPNLTFIALAFSISPIVVLLFASFVLYSTKFKKTSPSYKYIKFNLAKDIFNLGSEFFVVQIAALVLYQMINILISRLCGPEEVTNYNVAYKYLSIAVMSVNIILAPFWSAFTDAYVKQDKIWMMSIYSKLLKMFYLSLFGLILMVFASSYVYNIWIGSAVQIPIMTTVLVSIYVAFSIWSSIHGTIINGIGKIRFQVYYSIVIMLLFLPLANLFGNFWGINGIVSAMLFVNAPGLIFGRYQVLCLINNNAKGIWNK